MDKVKILIADDELRMRKLVADFLKREGYSIYEAENGKQAIDIFYEENNFDLVILDVMMPLIDGWSVCREIRTSSKVFFFKITITSIKRGYWCVC